MAISEAFSGSFAISTTEYDLPSASTTKSSQTTDGIYQLFIDLSALTATESYRLRIYEKTRSTSAQAIVEDITISGVQSEPVYVTPSLLLMHGWTYTLQKLQGTDRTIEWSIRQVA
jgi:hypothetical protein